MTDEELALACRSGDKSAWEELYKRYKPRVLAVARRFFLCGGETEDLVQEGMCGLYSAVSGYRADGGSFYGYASASIRNRILDTVRKSESSKNAALNGFLPIDEVGEELYYLSEDTEQKVIDRESRREFIKQMGKRLSALEFKAIIMYIDGMTMSEISSALGTGVKSVDNALSRAKNKIQKMLSEE